MRREIIRSIPECLVALDTETHRLRPGVKMPRLVCGSSAWFQDQRIVGDLQDREAALDLFAEVLSNPSVVIGGANIAFDLGVEGRALAEMDVDVMPEIFAALDPDGDGLCARGRVFDLQHSQALDAIAEGHLGRDPRTQGELKNPETGKRGSYSLSMCVDLVLGRKDAKENDEWRLRYDELDGVPIEEWPETARVYPVDDARNTAEVILAQIGFLPKISLQHEFRDTRGADGAIHSACSKCGSTRHSAQCLVRRPHKNLHDLSKQTASAFCLHLGDAWGLRVDQSRVDVVERHALKKRNAGIGQFVDAGVIREDETENQAELKKLVAIAYGSTEACEVCKGLGKIPHEDQPTLRCPDCKGRCQPWKARGEVLAPTVASCERCRNTGRVLHHNVRLKTCEGPIGAEGKPEKTCCGTGLVLTVDVPRTDTQDISIGKDPLHESGDDFLMALGDFKEDQKILNVYVPYLRQGRICAHCGEHGTKKFPHTIGCPTQPRTLDDGAEVPALCAEEWVEIALTLSSNAVLDTGRVSYRGLIQTFPRSPGFYAKDENGDPTDEWVPSLRECFVARGPEYELVDVDDDYVLRPGEFVVEGVAACS